MTYSELVAQIQQLSLKHQLRLVQTVTEHVGHHFSLPKQASQTHLRPLIGLDRAELHALAEAIVSPDHQADLHTLLRKNSEELLSDTESHRLDDLLTEVDQMALLKAKALYTLKLYDYMLGDVS